MNLSKNFSLTELTFSANGTKAGIDNTPDAAGIERLKALCDNVLQPVRDFLGESLTVSSGYRSPALNVITPNSSNTSQHTKCEAADIVCYHRNKEVFEFIKNRLVFDQLIWEYGDDSSPKWIHVSFSKKRNRQQILRAYIVNGKPKYVAL